MTDPKQGGDLFDMASQPETVKIPGDAGKMNTIPSKPRPDQIASETDSNYLGGDNLASAATNAGDIPRSTRDRGTTQEVLSGTGDSLPSTVDSKRMHPAPGGVVDDPLAKGHSRYEKHHRQQGGDEEYGATEGGGVDQDVPGLEGQSEERARDMVDRKEGI